MGYDFAARMPDATLRYVHVGTNGSQDVMLGLWLAAYGVAGRRASRRVRGRWYQLIPGAANVWELTGQSVSAARRLLAYNQDDCAWVIVGSRSHATIDRGLKLKPVTDPPLAALVDLWRVYNNAGAADRTLSPELTAQLAEAFGLLLPHLEQSCWQPIMAGIAGLFADAAAVGVGVSFG